MPSGVDTLTYLGHKPADVLARCPHYEPEATSHHRPRRSGLGRIVRPRCPRFGGSGANPQPTARALDGRACVAPRNARQQDVDRSDSAEVRFRRPAGQKVVVYFENRGAKQSYWKLVQEGAAIWSKSPCVLVLAVEKCPPKSNCVVLRQKGVSPDGDDTDGESEGFERDGYRVGGTITVYSNPIDDESTQGAEATVVHEMGHMLGLVHRNNEDDLMNAVTSDDTNPIPDSVDFQNLKVIYGKAGGGRHHRRHHRG